MVIQFHRNRGSTSRFRDVSFTSRIRARTEDLRFLSRICTIDFEIRENDDFDNGKYTRIRKQDDNVSPQNKTIVRGTIKTRVQHRVKERNHRVTNGGRSWTETNIKSNSHAAAYRDSLRRSRAP